MVQSTKTIEPFLIIFISPQCPKDDELVNLHVTDAVQYTTCGACDNLVGYLVYTIRKHAYTK